MWIFPEGTRRKNAELLPFKKGAFHIAMQNKLPIVPVIISPYTFINDEKKIFNHGNNEAQSCTLTYVKLIEIHSGIGYY
jgi:1-acyl-sn-glycerol-3-phosphate acyltransferase